MPDLKKVMSNWVRLGAMFGGPTARKTPDIERHIIDTARFAPAEPRLFDMAASWLAQFPRLVCRHRLAALAGEIQDETLSATLGYLLSVAKSHGDTDHFNLAIKACRPRSKPAPLFDIYQRNEKMRRFAKQQTEPDGLAWGLWVPPHRVYDDAIRSAIWIMKKNPSLQQRAILGGQLAASILVTLEENPDAGQSESALSRACKATRCAIRDALDHLELCGLISRRRQGAANPIRLST